MKIKKLFEFENTHKKTYTVQEAQEFLEQYCAYQERCRFHAEQKLKQMSMIPQAVDIIISHLISENFLNERRFAKAFVSGKFKIKKWGKYKIKNELKKLQISQQNIDFSLKNIDFESYKKTISELVLKKTANLNLKNVKHQKKCVDFLLSRGFEYELIIEELQNILKNE